jgi:isoquinoline 1-oxidoreductase beta subunit
MSGTQAPKPATNVNRRDILKGGAGLIVCLACSVSPREAAAASSTELGAYIQISSTNRVTVVVGSTEMGQGIMTGLAQLVADELMVDWSRVSAIHAPPGAAYANPLFHFQLTAGSSSMRAWYNPLRVAAAAAREMLIVAGAAALEAAPSACSARRGAVWVTGTTKRVPYGRIVAAAAQLTPPSNPPLVSNLRFIGKSMPRLDLPGKVNGSALFGIDVRLPGMLFAVVKHSPKLGGSVSGMPAKPAGATAVVNLGNAVAVVAKNTGVAMELAKELSVRWSTPASSAQLDSTSIRTAAQQLLDSGVPKIAESSGDPDAGLAGAVTRIESVYELPYLAHACLEPLNCTAVVTSTSCEVWAPTQSPALVAFTAQSLTGLPADKIRVNTMFMGGGLGRKFEQDYIAQAIKVAMAVNAPVKLTWTREEDFGNDQYRPMALVKVQAGLDRNGRVKGWIYRNVSPSITAQRNPGFAGIDGQATEGSIELDYAFAAQRVEYCPHPAAVPVGYWRSVGHSINCFAVESAIDELAAAAGIDPLIFRRRLLANNPRSLAVLNAAADLGNWSTRPAAGHEYGIAFSEAFGSLVAQVVEISAPTATSIRVHKVACAVDCGFAVNPGAVEAQIQGGIVHGLSAAMWGRMIFTKGSASPRNFNRSRVTRMREMPKVTVRIINSGEALGGIGEPGVPPIAPAIANAYARLTGTRLRTLPFFPDQSFMGDG